MKVYLVGGYVRDKLRGVSLKGLDKDHVVVGATPRELIDKGYKQVGESFPVFLHPDNREEYALARKEVKTAKGYHGFEFVFNPEITLEEDLLRRDFTVNAIAMDQNGILIDPYNGQEDIKKQILRHVSKHFVEDPLRLIRAARFCAILNYKLAAETKKLLLEIVDSGELETISKERILIEVDKTLNRGSIQIFVDTLFELGAWQTLFQEDKFKNYISELTNPEYKMIFFFYSLNREVLNRFPVSNFIKKSINNIDHFLEYSKDSNWLEVLNKLDAWRPGAEAFTESIDQICELFGEKWRQLSEMRKFTRDNIDKSGLDLFKGPEYGEELNKRRKSLIDKYIEANPLK